MYVEMYRNYTQFEEIYKSLLSTKANFIYKKNLVHIYIH